MQEISSKIPRREAVSSSSAASPPPSPPWIELPGDVTADILRRLGAKAILESAQRVCTTWRKVCKDPAMWRVVHLHNPSQCRKKYEILCRNAVDRSQGQLIELSVEFFGDGETINYIADRASNLKCLTLRGCYNICGYNLTQAIKKLPNLEELHLSDMYSLAAKDVRAIGLHCPNLKSFSFHGCESNHLHSRIKEYDEDGLRQYDYALAIGKSMPNLHHLQLFAYGIQDKNLEAILDGCPHLESLDLMRCYDLNIGKDLGKRCREQIKDLRLPFYPAFCMERLVGGRYDFPGYDVEFSFVSSYGYNQYDDHTNHFGYGLFGGDDNHNHPFGYGFSGYEFDGGYVSF